MSALPKLPAFTVGPAAQHRAVTAFPLFCDAPVARAYRLGADAIRDGALDVCEGRGHVLEANNRGRERVLLVEGDHLLGAHQNRMLTSSALVRGGSTTGLPVACVERGRSSGKTPRFDGAGPMASAALRRIAKRSVTVSLFGGRGGARSADQGAIWEHIASQQTELQVRSATSSLAHTYAARGDDIGITTGALRYVPHAVGLALGVAGELVSVDVFGDAATCAAYWPRLVGGAALDALRAERGRPLDAGAVHALIDAVWCESWLPVVAVGDGMELRALGSRAAASALFLDGGLVHFGLAAGDVSSSRPRARREIMPFELPEPLASRYRIVRHAGGGAAKNVYRATDVRTGADVAIARLPYVREDRFAHEVELLSQIASSYVPRIIESLVAEDDCGYLVMEYCGGQTLAQLGPLAVADAGPILVALARALQAIHQAHVLHRDVKLENVMLGADGALKVIDFGLSARAYSVSTAIREISTEGTLPHMAHEVLLGRELDARADVFAFGVCCYRLLVGTVPLPPRRGESELEYLERLRLTERFDLARLPALPAPAGETIARMLEVDREQRPFMPDVVAAFERAFGTARPAARPRRARPALALTQRRDIAVPIAAPEQLLVAPCRHAPLVALVPERAVTIVRALDADGEVQWEHSIDARLTAGVRADLDGDGVREVYLAGPRHLVALTARGELAFRTAIDTSERPQLLALPEARRLVLDGHILDPRSGRALGTLGSAYCGNGSELVRTDDLRGLAFNGVALQAFRGAHATAAAIVCHPDQPRFHVAHLEELPQRRGVQLVIYGPGGARTHALHVADCALATGDQLEISRIYAPPTPPLFGPAQAPIAVLGADRSAVVIVPLLGADRSLPSQLVAFELPSGRECWRHSLPGGTRALLAGRGTVVAGTGEQLVTYDAWTGEPGEPVASRATPVAAGDPFASGTLHVIAASPAGIELWQGGPCQPDAMTWSGPRGDLWRTGTLRADGAPFGPI